MQRAFLSSGLMGLVLLLTCAAFAKQAHAPLPAEVLSAKSVYIDNQSGFAQMADRAYDELTKWGRFQIVDSAEKADLVLLFSASTYDGGYVAHHTTHSSGSIYANTNTTYGNYGSNSSTSGNVDMNGTSTGTVRHVTVNYTHITLINPKTGASLWSDQKRWGWHSATRGLVKELRERIEEQEKAK